MLSNKKNLFLIIGGVVLVGLIVFLLLDNNGQIGIGDKTGQKNGATGSEMTADEMAAIEEDNINYAMETNENLAGAKMDVVGASPITPENVVVTFEGKPTDNAAEPASELAPKRSLNIDKETLPESVTLLNASAKGFSPANFEATANQPTTIAVSSTDDQVHVFKFDDPSLNAITVGVMPGETKAITFNAPAAGTYFFRCDVPEHKDRGEVGTMIVR